MRKFFLSTGVFLCLASSANAESCSEKFTRILSDQSEKGAVKIHITQEIKRGMTSRSVFYQLNSGHWMTEVVEPADMQWTLLSDNIIYSSSDRGETWTKVREFDVEENRRITASNMEENAKTVRDITCSTEIVDGVVLNTIEGTYDTLQNFKTENRHKYWLDPEKDWIVKAQYEMKGAGFESLTTQFVEKVSELELPKP